MTENENEPGGSASNTFADEASNGAVTEPSEETQKRLEEIRGLLVTRRAAEMTDLMELLHSKRRLTWINFLTGVSRGLGFFLGFSLVGAGVVALAAYFVDLAASETNSQQNLREMFAPLSAIKCLFQTPHCAQKRWFYIVWWVDIDFCVYGGLKKSALRVALKIVKVQTRNQGKNKENCFNSGGRR